MEDRYSWVDESSLNRTERLGLAYCRLNTWQWDDLFVEKPEGFDDLPNHVFHKSVFKKQIITKGYYIDPIMEEITRTLGEANVSWFWWKFALRETKENWEKWYYADRLFCDNNRN